MGRWLDHLGRGTAGDGCLGPALQQRGPSAKIRTCCGTLSARRRVDLAAPITRCDPNLWMLAERTVSARRDIGGITAFALADLPDSQLTTGRLVVAADSTAATRSS